MRSAGLGLIRREWSAPDVNKHHQSYPSAARQKGDRSTLLTLVSDFKRRQVCSTNLYPTGYSGEVLLIIDEA